MRGTTNVPSCYVILRRQNQALFVLRSNTGFMDGMYATPSGHVEDMESFKQAAVRETMEEVGVVVKEEDLSHVHTMHRRAHEGDHIRIDVFFETKAWEGEPRNAEPDKHSRIEWLDLGSLPENITDYQAHALKEIKEGHTYSEYGWN